MATEDQFICPECNQTCQEDKGWPRWCENCDWGVTKSSRHEHSHPLERAYLKLSKMHSKAMLAQLLNTSSEGLKPGFSSARLIAFGIATAVHFATLLVLVSGIYIMLTNWPHILLLLMGASLVALALLLFPWPTPLPAKDQIASNESFPTLYRTVNEMAAHFNAKPVHHIVLTKDFNASYTLAGLSRQPVIEIGLPLWITLEPDERLAIIAHELSHGVNGDNVRSWWVGRALQALDEWRSFLQVDPGASLLVVGTLGILFWLVSRPIAFVQHLLAQLLWTDSQKAEYYADYLATSLAGTPAMIRALHKLPLSEHIETFMLRSVHSSSQSGVQFFDDMQKFFHTIPPRELDRLKRSALHENAQLDASHPPTANRIAFLAAHAIPSAPFTVSKLDMDLLDAEIAREKEHLGGILIDQFLGEG